MGHSRRHRAAHHPDLFRIAVAGDSVPQDRRRAAAALDRRQAAGARTRRRPRQYRGQRQALGRRQDRDRGRPRDERGQRHRHRRRGRSVGQRPWHGTGRLWRAGQHSDHRLGQPDGHQADGPFPPHHHPRRHAAGLDCRHHDRDRSRTCQPRRHDANAQDRRQRCDALRRGHRRRAAGAGAGPLADGTRRRCRPDRGRAHCAGCGPGARPQARAGGRRRLQGLANGRAPGHHDAQRVARPGCSRVASCACATALLGRRVDLHRHADARRVLQGAQR